MRTQAIECGSIPVLARHGSLASKTLPPEFFDSPMVFVEDWTDDALVSLATLKRDTRAINQRQAALTLWYRRYRQTFLAQLRGDFKLV